tara:strand:- start:19 stop:1299 length:1281 start_codon:yes stop_codon:yes gene_type:complete
MATFNIRLDKRNKLKNDKFNLVIRVFNENTFVDLKVERLTQRQYYQIFIKNITDPTSVEFRRRANELKSFVEELYHQIGYLNKDRLREQFYNRSNRPKKSLLLKDLFEFHISNSKNKRKTIKRFQYTMNVIEKFKPNLLATDITVDFLNEFERERLKSKITPATISGNLRDLRCVLNFFIHKEPLLPDNFQYPFGKGGYSIKSSFSTKKVLSMEEINKILNFTSADKELIYARDIWELLYRCNGINFIDAFLMKWDYIQGDYIVFYRRKTETTRRNNLKPIEVPVDPSIQSIIEKWGDKNSSYVFGLMKEEKDETYLYNKVAKLKKRINKSLKVVTTILELSLPLTTKTARETYATTLLRGGVSKDEIGEMLGHSNSIVTEHYLAGLEKEKKKKINSVLPQRHTDKNPPQGFPQELHQSFGKYGLN